MTTYLYSSLNDGDSLSFNPVGDTLLFDSNLISAASVLLTQSGVNLVFAAGGKSITLLSVSLAQLTTSNVSFADGSQLLVGDTFVTTLGDGAANSLTGGAG